MSHEVKIRCISNVVRFRFRVLKTSSRIVIYANRCPSLTFIYFIDTVYYTHNGDNFVRTPSRKEWIRLFVIYRSVSDEFRSRCRRRSVSPPCWHTPRRLPCIFVSTGRRTLRRCLWPRSTTCAVRPLRIPTPTTLSCHYRGNVCTNVFLGDWEEVVFHPRVVPNGAKRNIIGFETYQNASGADPAVSRRLADTHVQVLQRRGFVFLVAGF